LGRWCARWLQPRVQCPLARAVDRPHIAPQHHWLLPINCHFRDCEARCSGSPCKLRYIKIRPLPLPLKGMTLHASERSQAVGIQTRGGVRAQAVQPKEPGRHPSKPNRRSLAAQQQPETVHLELDFMSRIMDSCVQGSHYILVVKFMDFSRTFKDAEVAFSRTNY